MIVQPASADGVSDGASAEPAQVEMEEVKSKPAQIAGRITAVNIMELLVFRSCPAAAAALLRLLYD